MITVLFDLNTKVEGFERKTAKVSKDEAIFWLRRWRKQLLDAGVKTKVIRKGKVITLKEVQEDEKMVGNPGHIFGYDIDFLLRRAKSMFPVVPVEEFPQNLGEMVVVHLAFDDELDIHDRDFLVTFDSYYEGREEVVRDAVAKSHTITESQS